MKFDVLEQLPERPKLHHVGIVMPDVEQVNEFVTMFGMSREPSVYVETYNADCYFVDSPTGRIELIVPRGAPLDAFNRGIGGLHHIALEVPDVRKAKARLGELGVHLLEESPVAAGSLLINFVPPVFTRGVIVELVESSATTTGGE